MELKRLVTNIPDKGKLLLITVAFLILIVPSGSGEANKYSKESNLNLRELRDPFRMAKVNSVWHKALHKLTDTKLRSLYTDLDAHDKEEVKLKRLLTDGMDKDGLKEAGVRKKFRELLSTYGLLEHFVDGAVSKKMHNVPSSQDENAINKSIFKDKKLAMLWDKAERSGFDQKQLKLLKEEFSHHQDKIDEYYSTLESAVGGEKSANFLDPLDDNEHMDHLDKSKLPSKKYPDGGLPVVNHVRSQHRDIKDGYDVLHKKIASAPNSHEFSEPRVANLWKLAQNSDFTPEELESLRQELKHYEKRVEKLQFFQSELQAKHTNAGGNIDKEHLHTDKDTSSFYADKIKRHERHIEKIHLELETKIMNRHGEL